MSKSGARCAICGKGRHVGRQVSHSGTRTRRVFAPNLQWKRLTLAGLQVRIKICTKCLKRMKRDGKIVTNPRVLTPAAA